MRAVWEVSVNFRVFMVGLLLVGTGASALGQKPPLLPEKDVAALANELSGETAKRNLEGIARFHRQRGSKGFHEAAELVAGQLRAYGLSDVEILQFPADGKIFYGTQRSRPAWTSAFHKKSSRLLETAESPRRSTHMPAAAPPPVPPLHEILSNRAACESALFPPDCVWQSPR